MNTFKNYLIALLTGLLVLTITAQPSTGASKSYDAVKLAEYTACMNGLMNWDIAAMQVSGGGSFDPVIYFAGCYRSRPK